MKLRTIITAVPLILVNCTAFAGQLAFLRDHLSWNLAGDIIFASSLESCAIFVAYMAHAALLSGDSATRLRLASYGLGLTIGAMNASHYIRNGHITFAAVALGLMSSSSPFLWGIFSRRQSRDALMSSGMIEGHAVRLGFTRWLFHPVRSFRVFSRATWTGENDPVEAIALLDMQLVAPEVIPLTIADMKTKADTVRYAVRELAKLDHGNLNSVTASQVTEYLREHSAELKEPGWNIPLSYSADVIRRDVDVRTRLARARMRAIGSGQGSDVPAPE